MKNFIANEIRIIAVLILSLSLVLSAFASTISKESVTIETAPGRYEKVDVTTTAETVLNPDGSTTVKKESAASSYRTGSGYTVQYTAASSMTTNSENITTGAAETEYSAVNSARTYAAIGGTEETIRMKAPLAEIEIPLVSKDDADESSEASKTVPGPASGSSSSTGDLKENSADGDYDYTVDTVVTSGNIRVTTLTVEKAESFKKAEGEREYLYSDTLPDADNDLFYDTKCLAVIPENKEDLPSPADGYEYVYIGGGYSSQFWAAYWYTSKSEDYLEETPFYTDSSNTSYYLRQSHKVNSRYNVEGAYLNGELVLPYTSANPAVYSSIYHFTMANPETGRYASTYCADLTTHALNGYSYNMHNLEDTTHYTESEADKIRAIAMSGYWGIADDPNTKEAEPGSLEAMKEMMRTAVDDAGKRIFTDDEIALLTDGAALTATQYAIWAQSNKMNDIEFINTHKISKNSEFKNDENTKKLGDIPESERPKVLVLFKLYEYLSNLPAMKITENTTANTIINADNFQKSIRVTIKDKPMNYANNLDDNKDNDVYLADLRFSLAAVPAENNGDDLTIRILDGNNYELAAGRIASPARSGETLLLPDDEGYYTFENIPLTENQWKITVSLTGTQNLSRGVCLFTSEEKDGETSQIMVGVSEGPRSVDVSLSLILDFDIEDSVVQTTRMWRATVPASSVPETGDDYTKQLLVFVLSAAALSVYIFARRKKAANA